MTIKVYVSGISGSHEVRKQQQRVLFILQSLPIDLKIIDVTDPGQEEDLTFMQEEVKKHEKKTQLPPQIFNDDKYCGDYVDFALANDDDEIMRFLKLEDGPSKLEQLKKAAESGSMITQNGVNHDSNKEEQNTADEPTTNGINDTESVSKDEEAEPMETETNEVEKPVEETLVTEESEKPINEAEVPVKDEDEKKESSEEESEEESE